MSSSGTVIHPRMEAVRSRWPDERDLLSRVSAQDLQAFERLYRMYRPRLARFLMGMLKRPQLIEEVLDDTMMVVWQTAGNFRGSSKPSTWIFAIAYRKALKARARWPEPVEEDDFDARVSPDPAPDQQLHHQRLHDALIEAMNHLSIDHRTVVDLTYFHGMGYREIAEIVNCPVDTVKTRMFHARRRLKQALNQASSASFADWL